MEPFMKSSHGRERWSGKCGRGVDGSFVEGALIKAGCNLRRRLLLLQRRMYRVCFWGLLQKMKEWWGWNLNDKKCPPVITSLEVTSILSFLCLCLMNQQQYFCRDSGFGRVTLSLWMLEWDDDIGDYVRKREQPLIDQAQSDQCAVEVSFPRSFPCFNHYIIGQHLNEFWILCILIYLQVGGGPWGDVWSVSSKMSSSLKWMVRLPYRLRNTLTRMG